MPTTAPPSTRRTKRNATGGSLATAAFGEISTKAWELRTERNELALYIELLGLAGATLHQVAGGKLAARADALTQWCRDSSTFPPRRPAGLKPMLHWLRSRQSNTRLLAALAHPKLQRAAVGLYRNYRNQQQALPAQRRLRSGRNRWTTWEEVDAALELCNKLGYGAEELRRTTQQLSSWRAAPKRNPLRPELLRALLPTVVQPEAHKGTRSLTHKRR